MRTPFHAVRVLVTALLLSCTATFAQPKTSKADAAAIEEFKRVAHAEVASGALSGVSIAWVDDQRILFVEGFGWADKKKRVPARPNTVYRAGSISKLFAAIATMQLAEKGQLDLDKPVTEFNAAFSIVNRFPDSGPITLRQLMCHRSGLIRECPVGSYFDDTEPSVDATVASMADCVLVYPPNTRTKYSNSGVTVVGQTVEKISRRPFSAYQDSEVLGPMGMTNSSFILTKELRSHLAQGYMPVADGKGGFHEIVAPVFQLGTLPAGNLYTTAEDLALFLKFIFARGKAGERQLIQTKTLQEMFTPQLTKEASGFGLGFHVSSFAGRKKISHTGAVYGFSTSFTALPDEKLGVVILANDDIATGPVAKLNDLALNLMLRGRGLMPARKETEAFIADATDLAACAGDYESQSYWARIDVTNAVLRANVSGQQLELRPKALLTFEGFGRIAHESPFAFKRSGANAVAGFTALGQEFKRVAAAPESKIPEQWNACLGSYGPSFIPLIVSLRHGHLYAMTENMFDYRLRPLNQTVFDMSPGLYVDEHLVFRVDRRGRIQGAVLANMNLPRERR